MPEYENLRREVHFGAVDGYPVCLIEIFDVDSTGNKRRVAALVQAYRGDIGTITEMRSDELDEVFPSVQNWETLKSLMDARYAPRPKFDTYSDYASQVFTLVAEEGGENGS